MLYMSIDETEMSSVAIGQNVEKNYCVLIEYGILHGRLQQELMLRQSTTDVAMDPFLSGMNEQHARQESADSGLGLGSAYSLPHTPEDFLANIDDNMDATSGELSTFYSSCWLHYGYKNAKKNYLWK